MRKPKLKLVPFPYRLGKGWWFLDYGGGTMKLMEKRIHIEYREEFKDYQICHAFPYTNEKGIKGEIEELKLAMKAIKILKRKWSTLHLTSISK